MENNCLVSDQTEVCNILNDFYINIAQEIGINNQQADSSAMHPSIQAIKDNSSCGGYATFAFKPVSESQVFKIVNSLNSKNYRFRSNPSKNTESGGRGTICTHFQYF